MLAREHLGCHCSLQVSTGLAVRIREVESRDRVVLNANLGSQEVAEREDYRVCDQISYLY